MSQKAKNEAIERAKEASKGHPENCDCLDCIYLNHSRNCTCRLCKVREE